jgi:prophage DNA circulation protein
MSERRQASYREVVFEVVDATDEGGRALVLAEYAGRDGASVEDTGGLPRRGSLVAAVWGPECAADLARLLAVFSLEGAGTLVHPVFGPIEVCVERWTVRQGSEPLDEAEVSFDWVEDAFDTGLELLLDTPAAKGNALEGATLTMERIALETPNNVRFIARVRALAGRARAFLTRVRNPNLAALRTATQTLAEVQALAQETIDTVRTVQDPNNQPLVRQVKALVRTCNQLWRVTASEAPPWVEYTVRAWTSARLIATELYGNPSRAREIVQVNALRDPGRIGPGTVLSVRAR